MLIFNTLTTAAVAKFSFNPAATKPCVTLVCLQEGTSPFHSVHKETKQRAAQVSCWWMLSQVQPEDTPPLESMGGMDQGRWTLHSNKPYMTQCISEEQQECLFPRSTQEHHHQKAGENAVILDQSEKFGFKFEPRKKKLCIWQQGMIGQQGKHTESSSVNKQQLPSQDPTVPTGSGEKHGLCICKGVKHIQALRRKPVLL